MLKYLQFFTHSLFSTTCYKFNEISAKRERQLLEDFSFCKISSLLSKDSWRALTLPTAVI